MKTNYTIEDVINSDATIGFRFTPDRDNDSVMNKLADMLVGHYNIEYVNGYDLLSKDGNISTYDMIFPQGTVNLTLEELESIKLVYTTGRKPQVFNIYK